MARDDYQGYGDDPHGYGAGGRRHHRGGRGFFERATDEVKSWFGDEEAERHRRLDELRSRYGYRYSGHPGEPEFETRKPGGRYDRTESQAGRGPRGWRRSDERIFEDVCELMTEHPDLDASDIEVRVSGGEVTLEGSVESRWAKRLAEDIADSVSGVRDVHNRLRVNDVVSRYVNQYSESPYPM